MIKILRLLMVLLLGNTAAIGQLIIQPQLPGGGLILQEQIWNLMVNNASTTPVNGIVQILLTDNATGQPIYEGSSRTINFVVGANIITHQSAAPVPPRVNGNPNDINSMFLPAGSYTICYSIIRDGVVKGEALARECTNISSEPLMPPLLVYPYDQSVIKISNMVFSWTPPSPSGIMPGLHYDFQVFQVENGQSLVEAADRNRALYSSDVNANYLNLNPAMLTLRPTVAYAWRILGKDQNGNKVKSDVWSFSVMPDSVMGIVDAQAYIDITAAKQEVFDMHQGLLKLRYQNDRGDTLLHASIEAMSGGREAPKDFTIPLTGENIMIIKNVNGLGRFRESEVYKLTIVNGVGEAMVLRFTPKYYF
jgi:hypothetical protein